MVAVPAPAQALLARPAGVGGTMPSMSVKIALRGGNQESFRRWIANRNDVITANGLDQLMDHGQMPTLETVKERFPGLSSEQQQATQERALHQYQGENTALYFLVQESVVISGTVSKDGTSCWAPDQPAQRLICFGQLLYFAPCTQLTGAELCGSRHCLLLCG